MVNITHAHAIADRLRYVGEQVKKQGKNAAYNDASPVILIELAKTIGKIADDVDGLVTA